MEQKGLEVKMYLSVQEHMVWLQLGARGLQEQAWSREACASRSQRLQGFRPSPSGPLVQEYHTDWVLARASYFRAFQSSPQLWVWSVPCLCVRVCREMSGAASNMGVSPET